MDATTRPFSNLQKHLKGQRLNRRRFMKSVAISAAFAPVAAAARAFSSEDKKISGADNPLPRWRGFNLTDFTSPNPSARHSTTDDDLKWMVDWGFDFIRLPLAYP